ncbi:hypothetical protein LEP1GSC193_1433 [Leptospira alstonii serovar Pingchang str. 80-412]|uniref:Uncharacterized protein n=2 Tax=Leptospira alstonii TaxID=28452 RepID=M6CZD4_9LEPT|nr:hypothetical protein LEP1GSC194_0628 [Leptospira alstonii serovar Sichuan str. 79601]EQA81811.1 hypothetical protein LEP1GSC193_1433 [Leptospira alstonii serovar Pingchang str. 80-412]
MRVFDSSYFKTLSRLFGLVMIWNKELALLFVKEKAGS